MGNGQANVGVGLFLVDGITGDNLKALFQRFLESCDHVREIMRDARPLSEVRGAPLRCSLSGAKPVSDGLLLAGETIGTTYALSGEGIGKAMESGRLAAVAAAEALAAGSFDAATLSRYEIALGSAIFRNSRSTGRTALARQRHLELLDLARTAQPACEACSKR
jgi:flavin-dependent dehydrogenase